MPFYSVSDHVRYLCRDLTAKKKRPVSRIKACWKSPHLLVKCKCEKIFTVFQDAALQRPNAAFRSRLDAAALALFTFSNHSTLPQTYFTLSLYYISGAWAALCKEKKSDLPKFDKIKLFLNMNQTTTGKWLI